MKDVKVLVSSCACNQKFLTLVEKVVKENGIDAKVSAVSDIMEQMQYNVCRCQHLWWTARLWRAAKRVRRSLYNY